jgi:hypothetical protein
MTLKETAQELRGDCENDQVNGFQFGKRSFHVGRKQKVVREFSTSKILGIFTRGVDAFGLRLIANPHMNKRAFSRENEGKGCSESTAPDNDRTFNGYLLHLFVREGKKFTKLEATGCAKISFSLNVHALTQMLHFSHMSPKTPRHLKTRNNKFYFPGHSNLLIIVTANTFYFLNTQSALNTRTP